MGLFAYEPDDYQYVVSWSAEDEVFVARVVDFPLLATHGDSMDEALAEAKRLVEVSLAMLAEDDASPPVPLKHRPPAR